MSEEINYQKKEDAKMHLAAALRDYISAAESYGYDESSQACEIEDILFDECGKKWDILPQ